MIKHYLELSEEQGASHKFYEVTIDLTTVTIRYGRIGDKGQTQIATHSTPEEALKFANKKVQEKVKKGYAPAVMGVRSKRAITRRTTESKPSLIKHKLPILWKFQTEAAAFGIYIDDRNCWVGNEKGDVFRLNHQGELTLHQRLPDSVKCIVADSDWIYVGCDDGNVYDLTGKRPRLSYEINEKIDIYWLDINDGLLGVSDASGRATIINYEDEEQWSKQQSGRAAWMMRCDDRGKVFYGDSAGITAFNGPDGRFEWEHYSTGAVLFGWMEDNALYVATSHSLVQVFSKNGIHLRDYKTDATVYSCAASKDGEYVFAGDNYSSIYCFNISGQRLWKLATGCGSALSMQYFQEKLYAVTTDGVLLCIDASEDAILNAQAGIVPVYKDIKVVASQLSPSITINDTLVLETTQNPNAGVQLQCQLENGQLRVKVISEGYNKNWHVQFPKNLRQEGAIYVVDEVREASQGGFYRVFGNILKLQN